MCPKRCLFLALWKPQPRAREFALGLRGATGERNRSAILKPCALFMGAVLAFGVYCLLELNMSGTMISRTHVRYIYCLLELNMLCARIRGMVIDL
jgi:hypothetical protein